MKNFDFDSYCNKVLFKNFPELFNEPGYEDAVMYADNMSTIIYENAFIPYILKMIKENNPDNKKKLNKAFDMIEKMLDHKNFQVHCVAKISFIEPFLVKLEPTKDIEKYLRTKSLAAARDLARKWFKINPETWEATV